VIPAGTPTEESGFEWKILDDYSCEITGVVSYPDHIVIPEMIEGYRVVSIGNGAFFGRDMSSVTIPDGVISIGTEAFFDCYSLSYIDIPDSVTEIGYKAFAGCTSLQEIVLPRYIKTIPDFAFRDCTSLRIVKIGSTLQRILPGAFMNCTSLSEIGYYEGTVNEWNAVDKSDGWDKGTPDYTVYCTDGNVDGSYKMFSYITYGNECTITGYNGTDTDVTVPEYIGGHRVVRIAEDAFSGRTDIQTLNINSGVEIADGAFIGCTGLKVAYILSSDPNNETVIGAKAFADCTGLEQIYVANVQSIGSEAFMNCTSLTAVYFNDSSIASIGDRAFADCSVLTAFYYPGKTYEWRNVNKADGWDNSTPNYIIYCAEDNISKNDGAEQPSEPEMQEFTYNVINGDECEITGYNGTDTDVTIPEYIGGYRVTGIGEKAFAANGNIVNITMPSTIKRIEDYAFQGCIGIINVTVPEGVEFIGNGAFSNCGSLVTVNLPTTVTEIGGEAFASESLLRINVEAGNPAYKSENGVLLSADGKTLICHPRGMDEFVIPEGVEVIGNGAFEGCSNTVNTIVLPESVTVIGDNAFSNINLVEVTLPAGMQSIGSQAFSSSGNLSTINYNGTVTEWEAIEKGAGWHVYTGNYTVYCTDGTVAKDGTVTYN
jgi:hypothetical protein